MSRFPIHPAIRWRFWCSQRPLDIGLAETSHNKFQQASCHNHHIQHHPTNWLLWFFQINFPKVANPEYCSSSLYPNWWAKHPLLCSENVRPLWAFEQSRGQWPRRPGKLYFLEKANGFRCHVQYIVYIMSIYIDINILIYHTLGP